MTLYPQDLRPRHYRALVAQREATLRAADVQSDGELPTPEQRALLDGMLTNTRFTGGAMAAGFSLAALGLALASSALADNPAIVALALPVFVFAYPFAAAVNRASLRRLHSSLSVREVGALIDESRGRLDRAYLELVRTALGVSLSKAQAASIRASIVAIAQAIEQVPPLLSEGSDPEALAAQADALAAQAQAEPDALIADSLGRRAAALERQADAARQNALTFRRTHALHEEIATQIATLREGLAALAGDGTGGRVALADLEGMAEAVRRAAAESTSLAQAHAELEEPLRRYSDAREEPPHTVTLR